MFKSIAKFFKSLWTRLFPAKYPAKMAGSRDYPLLERKSWSGKAGTYMEYQITFYQEVTIVTPIVYPDHFLVNGLPPGLNYTQSTGLIFGTPTTVGKYGVTITAVGPETHATQSTGVVFTVRSS
jgi:hypothetical protein